MTKYTYSEWIEHDGKGMPVDGDVLVSVRFKGGDNLFEDSVTNAFYHDSKYGGWTTSEDEYFEPATISAYRIATPIDD